MGPVHGMRGLITYILCEKSLFKGGSFCQEWPKPTKNLITFFFLVKGSLYRVFQFFHGIINWTPEGGQAGIQAFAEMWGGDAYSYRNL